MNGQYVYLPKSGPVLVGGTYAWEPSPLVGTVTFVSATQMTLSFAVTTAVTGGVAFIGADATAAWQAALNNNRFMRIPAGVHLLLAGHVVLGDGQVVAGAGSAASSVRSVTLGESPIVTKRGAVNPAVRGLSVWGTASGSQPANVMPPNGADPDLSSSGCGVAFINAQGGLIEDVTAYHCGGDAVTTGRNGIAGIYLTMGCTGVVVARGRAYFNRNGINEDSYFNPTNDDAYAAKYNTLNTCEASFNVFGIGIDSGSLSRGTVLNDPRADFNVQTGISVNASKQVVINSPRTSFNGVGFTNCGIQVHGTSATVIAEHVTIINPISFGNGTHGIKVSDWARYTRIIGGDVSRNFRCGIYFNNNADNGLVFGTSVRANGLGLEANGERDGMRVTSSVGVRALIFAFDDQDVPSQQYGFREAGTANGSIILDGTLFGIGNVLGDYLLTGATSRYGAFSAAEILRRAQGFRGETFSRVSAVGGTAFASGDQRAVLIAMRKGEKVSSLLRQVTVAGSGVTLAKAGIWDSAGTLLASTADFSAAVAATGVISAPLTSSWTAPADGAYYVGDVYVGGTPPTLLRGSSGITGYTGQALPGAKPVSVGNSGKTDLGTLSITSSGNAFWFAWA
jgi:hypothetical protein